MAQHCAQCVRVKLWIPGTMRPVVVAQNADQSIGEIGDLGRMDRFVGARQQSCLRNLEMAEIDRIAGPELGLGYMQRKRGLVAPARSEEHTSELQSLMRITYA